MAAILTEDTQKLVLKDFICELFPRFSENITYWEFYRFVFQQEQTQLLFGKFLAQYDMADVFRLVLQHEDIRKVFQEILEEEDIRQFLRRFFQQEDVLECLRQFQERDESDSDALRQQVFERKGTRELWKRISRQADGQQRFQQVKEQEKARTYLYNILQLTGLEELLQQVFDQVVSEFLLDLQHQQDLIIGSEWRQLIQQQQHYKKIYHLYFWEQWEQSEWQQQREQQERYNEAYIEAYMVFDQRVQAEKQVLKIYVCELFPSVCEDRAGWELYRDLFQQEHTPLLFGEVLAQRDTSGMFRLVLQHEDIRKVFQEIVEEEDVRQFWRCSFHQEDILACISLLQGCDESKRLEMEQQASQREDTRELYRRLTQQTDLKTRINKVYKQEMTRIRYQHLLQDIDLQLLFKSMLIQAMSKYTQKLQNQGFQQDLINGSEWRQLLRQQQRYEEAYNRYYQVQAEREQWEQSEWRQQRDQQERYDEAYYFHYLPVQAQWKQIVHLTKAFYPNALTGPCLVPALHFNRIPLAATTFQGLTMYTLTSESQGLSPSKDKRRAKSQKTAQKKPNSKLSNSSKATGKARTSQSQLRKSCVHPETHSKCFVSAHTTVSVSNQPSKNISPDTSSQPPATSSQECIPKQLWSSDDFQPERDKLNKVLKDSIQADTAQGRLLHNLKQLGDRQREGMFIVSELDYDDYLCDKQHFSHAVDSVPQLKNRVMDTPVGISKKDDKRRSPREGEIKGDQNKGDIDILLISPVRGLLVCEVKSVDSNNDKTLKNKVLDACKQLDKSENVVLIG